MSGAGSQRPGFSPTSASQGGRGQLKRESPPPPISKPPWRRGSRAVALARAAVRRRGASSPRKPPWRCRSLSAQTGDAVVVRGGL
jgi:hypothetical protein